MKNNFVKQMIRRAIYGLIVVFCVLGFAWQVKAADLNWTSDTNISINGATYTIMSGSAATSLVTDATTFTVTVPTSSTFTMHSTDRYYLNNNGSLGQNCTASYNELVVNGPVTSLIITPDKTGVCTVPAAGGSGGSGGSSYSPPAIVTVTPPVVTPPAVVLPTTPDVTSVVPPTTPAGDQGTEQLVTISSEASSVFSAPAANVAETMGQVRNVSLEEKYSNTIVAKFVPTNAAAAVKNDIVNFVTYGTPTSTILGAGERAGVVASFKVTFGKLPSTEADWVDVLKIANGRVPTVHNEAKEKTSTVAFKKIYGREANLKQAHDQNAINIMTYGLRVPNRNLNSEANAIKSFKAIYGKAPATTNDWDILRAIAYSGAKK